MIQEGVAIDADDELAPRQVRCRIQRDRLALVDGVVDDAEAGVLQRHLVQEGARTIAAAVVDGDDLVVRVVHLEQVPERLTNVGLFVETRHDDADHRTGSELGRARLTKLVAQVVPGRPGAPQVGHDERVVESKADQQLDQQPKQLL